MSTGHDTLTAAAREAGMRQLDTFINGGMMPHFFEEQGDMSLANLKAAASKASKACVKTPLRPEARMMANYAVALYRDALYARTGRRGLQALGIHNQYRSLYEGGKLGIDSRGTK